MLHQKYYVYVFIILKDHKFYVGFTTDLKRRFKEHTEGQVIAIKNRLPLKLIHYEYFINETDAKARERWFWQRSVETIRKKNSRRVD